MSITQHVIQNNDKSVTHLNKSKNKKMVSMGKIHSINDIPFDKTLMSLNTPPPPPKIPVKFNDVVWRNIKAEDTHSRLDTTENLEQNKLENL